MTLKIYLGVLYLVFGITLFYRKSLLKSDFRYLFWLICLTATVESIGTFYLNAYNKSHPWLFKVYHLASYPLICMYFLRIHENKNVHMSIYFSIFVSTSYHLILLGFPATFGYLNKYKFLVIASFIVTWSVIYFRNLLNSHIELNLKKDPHFYINTGFLLFFGGSFFLMGLIFYVQERNMPLAKSLYSINHVLNIFYYSLLAYGFICHSRLMKS